MGASTDTSTSSLLRKMTRRRGESGWVKKAMYGARDALAAWQSEVERTVKEAGFKQSPTTPYVCLNEATNVRVVHVDDFLCTGPEPGLANLRRCLQNKYMIKFDILGAGQMKRRLVNSWDGP